MISRPRPEEAVERHHISTGRGFRLALWTYITLAIVPAQKLTVRTLEARPLSGGTRRRTAQLRAEKRDFSTLNDEKRSLSSQRPQQESAALRCN